MPETVPTTVIAGEKIIKDALSAYFRHHYGQNPSKVTLVVHDGSDAHLALAVTAEVVCQLSPIRTEPMT